MREGLTISLAFLGPSALVVTHAMLRRLTSWSCIIVVNRFFMKLFKTNNIDVVNYCRMQFNFELPSVTIAQRSRKFADKYRLCDNALCKSFAFR